MTFSRETIDAIAIDSTEIAFGIDGNFGPFRRVVDIHAKRDDVHGKLFVCGYVAFGDNARISFSVKESDEADARHFKIRDVTPAPESPERLRPGRNLINEAGTP